MGTRGIWSEGATAALRRHWHWLMPAVTLALLAAPLASDRTFASDWGNHLWLVQAQGENIAQLGMPSYYLESTLGAFYPYYAFYGGTLYVFLGFGSWLFSAEAAVVLAYAACLAIGYLSWTWIASLAGIRGWLIQIPGLLAVTAPFAVTNSYGRGGIPEFVGGSMIPLVAAAGISLIRSDRLRPLPSVAFVVGLVFLTGSHVLTMVWGLTLLALFGAILIACDWRSARRHAGRGLRLLALAALAFAINAWILVPTLLYHGKVQEGGPDSLSQLAYTDHTQLFSLFREGAHLDPVVQGDINAQLPVLALIWTVAFGAFFWGYLTPERRRIATGLTAVCAGFLVLVLVPSLIDHLPSALHYIQFPYRLLTFFDLALVGLATLVIAAMQRSGSIARVPAALLVIVAAVSLYQAVVQNHQVRSWLPGRAEALSSTYELPASWYAWPQFADASAPLLVPTIGGTLEVPVAEGIRDEYTVSAPPGEAGTVATNVLAGTYFVDVEGAEPVGRLQDGQMVVALPASDTQRQVTFRSHWSTAVDVGIWISLAAIAVAAFGLAWMLSDPERLAFLRRAFTRRNPR